MRVALYALTCLVVSAHADVMHWSWEVEVNGVGVDATRPVIVETGDRVTIEHWAAFDPYLAGFAAAQFSIETGNRFFEFGEVNLSSADGFGMNGILSGLGDVGASVDTDSDGMLDRVEGICPLQLPSFFNGPYDFSEPIFVYRIGWDITATPRNGIDLSHAPTLDGVLYSVVYEDVFGSQAMYDTTSDVLRFIPSPGAPLLGVIVLAAVSRRRRTSC